ncbi:hypothetical protein OUZ56_017059 [Daphnia magna]|uniref:Uncharacterized protein n=1 Tax=Daphnia magna TaxID=35525 RepID=A0ABR0AS17_9CRUS|nr:hypothetical protein OUZ56_017059 [Daphnia magna]
MVENLDCVTILAITSKPCDDVYEETHPDWAPTIFKSMNHSATKVSRYNRVKKRLAVNEKPIETGIKHELFMPNFSSEATELSISGINMADVLSSTMIIYVEDQENSAKLLSQLRNLETENTELREKNLCANKELEAAKVMISELAAKLQISSEKLYEATDGKARKTHLTQLKISENNLINLVA